MVYSKAIKWRNKEGRRQTANIRSQTFKSKTRNRWINTSSWKKMIKMTCLKTTKHWHRPKHSKLATGKGDWPLQRWGCRTREEGSSRWSSLNDQQAAMLASSSPNQLMFHRCIDQVFPVKHQDRAKCCRIWASRANNLSLFTPQAQTMRFTKEQ